MKTCFTYAILLISLLWVGNIFGVSDKAQAILTCDSPSCERVAEKIEYQYKESTNSITLKTDNFSIEVPDKPIRKIISSNKDLMILYTDDQLLYVSESSGPGIEDISSEKPYRFPEILFTKTIKDTPAETGNEKLFWNIALASKPFYFQGATEVTYTKNNDLTYYLSNTHELGFSARSMVANSQFKQLFLVIEAKQMDLSTFKQVVYSVK
ncbi:MAG: hypothetical protein KZQ93_16685 [Candidatus Thiodiazotropha sp. (ex Monitilora ramsayi)]|nr:hypothetical protein [Candidatus Thiodiazotropha sp. (ex Monitilora ramsayi)]